MYIVLPANRSNEALREALLETHGFKQIPSYWEKEGTPEQALDLRVLVNVRFGDDLRSAEADRITGSRAVL